MYTSVGLDDLQPKDRERLYFGLDLRLETARTKALGKGKAGRGDLIRIRGAIRKMAVVHDLENEHDEAEEDLGHTPYQVIASLLNLVDGSLARLSNQKSD